MTFGDNRFDGAVNLQPDLAGKFAKYQRWFAKITIKIRCGAPFGVEKFKVFQHSDDFGVSTCQSFAEQ